jgi:hypothetical protein
MGEIMATLHLLQNGYRLRVSAVACSPEAFGKEVATVIAFLASRPASYPTVRRRPMEA